MAEVRRWGNARLERHEGRPSGRKILRGIRPPLQGGGPRARRTGPERGRGEAQCSHHARGAGDAAPLGGERAGNLCPVGDHERLGVRRLRQNLRRAGHRLRQDLLRIADLPAGQGAGGRGTPQRGLLPPSRQLGVDRPHRRRAGRKAAAARRRHLGLHDAGPRHGLPPFRGQPPRRTHLRGGQRAELPLPGPQTRTEKARLRGMERPHLPPLLRHGGTARRKNEVARRNGRGCRRPD